MKKVKIYDNGSIKIKKKPQKPRNQIIIQRIETVCQRVDNSIEIKSERVVRLVRVSDEYIKENRPSAYEYMFK